MLLLSGFRLEIIQKIFKIRYKKERKEGRKDERKKEKHLSWYMSLIDIQVPCDSFSPKFCLEVWESPIRCALSRE